MREFKTCLNANYKQVLYSRKSRNTWNTIGLKFLFLYLLMKIFSFQFIFFIIKIKFIIVTQIFISNLILSKTGLERRFVWFCNPFPPMRFISIAFKIKVYSKFEANLKWNLFEQNFLAFKFNTQVRSSTLNSD